jgi:hypothetical protein
LFEEKELLESNDIQQIDLLHIDAEGHDWPRLDF